MFLMAILAVALQVVLPAVAFLVLAVVAKVETEGSQAGERPLSHRSGAFHGAFNAGRGEFLAFPQRTVSYASAQLKREVRCF